MRTTNPPSRWLLLLVIQLTSCVADSKSAAEQDRLTLPESWDHGVQSQVMHWGGMRKVLRDGQTEGRVALAEVVGPYTVAVGAMADLAGEITIDAGRVQLAQVIATDSVEVMRVRAPVAGDQATLLVLANVREWTEHALPDLPNLAALEGSVRAHAEANAFDTTRPFPFRIEGTANAIRLHVINHSCPIADPTGPKPWRFADKDAAVTLIGFYATGSEGKLTHHGQETHIHALLTSPAVSGHLEDVNLVSGARLFLPRR